MSTSSAVSADVKAVAIRSVEIMGAGERAEFDVVVHPEAINREGATEPPDCRGHGPAAYYATALWLRAAFSELRHEVHAAVVEGDTVVLHTTMSGRHTGPFVVYTPEGEVEQAFPATGKTFAITQSHWLRVRDGKVIEHWANRDDLGMAQQAGWVPPTPAYLVRMAMAKRAAKRRS